MHFFTVIYFKHGGNPMDCIHLKLFTLFWKNLIASTRIIYLLCKHISIQMGAYITTEMLVFCAYLTILEEKHMLCSHITKAGCEFPPCLNGQIL